MKNITIKDNIIPNINEILILYQDAGWTSYTVNPNQLEKAIKHSLAVWTAWDEDKLVGLARIVGDNYTIIYIQDILVLNDYQRNGIGSTFIKLILNKYQTVRQIVLLTESSEKTISFYESNGLKQVEEYGCTAFMK